MLGIAEHVGVNMDLFKEFWEVSDKRPNDEKKARSEAILSLYAS